MKRLYTNLGYDPYGGKDDETWCTLCEACLADNIVEGAYEQIVTEAEPYYEGHVLTCADCGKTD